MLRFPKPLSKGDLIAVTAPSSGVSGGALQRLDLVLEHLRSLGYRVVEGDCLRAEHKDARAPRDTRAKELMRFLVDPQDLAPTQTDPLTTAVLSVLAADFSTPVRQNSSSHYQTKWIDFAIKADAPLNLTEPTLWKRLDGVPDPVSFRGRLIGGCVDTIAWLAGSKYGDIPGFVRASRSVGTVLYIENVEMPPPALVRALLAVRRSGWFDGLSGLLVGRSAGPVPDSPDSLSYAEALVSTLGDLPFPVLYDVDIGHQPPQFTLINGAVAHVEFAAGRGSISQVAGS
jgi:muramoyltetrapeptide carboxypeptidase LdcA involved in peptidoglycan recycling